jgi:hypothetical protein
MHDPRGLGTAVVRIALAPNTRSVAAVFQSLLALSSLHRDGPQPHALTLKVSALRALAAAASSTNLGTGEEVIQHVAAGMLLCSFEVKTPPQPNKQVD